MPPSHTPVPDDRSSQDVASTFCATLVDEWIHSGVRHAVVAPGSRSTPLALALAARDELQLHVFHDERSASFAALGIGSATGIPAVLLCTSGTAATHFHAAVVEAHQSAVPMVVCTADRPPELRDVGAPQTIDQTMLYGAAVRWFHDPGVAGADASTMWRSTAAHAFATTTGVWPGPVHLNLPFREPLVGEAGELPARGGSGRVGISGIVTLAAADLADVEASITGRRGIVVAGRGCGDPDVVAGFAAAIGWPVLVDARSGLRTGRDVHVRIAITAFDDIVRSPTFTAANRPEVVVRLGEPPASKVLSQWLASADALQIHISALPTWTDPDGVIDMQITADPTQVCAALAATALEVDVAWLAGWIHAEQLAQKAIDSVIHDGDRRVTEPAAARLLGQSLPAGASLVVSSSMPVRDIEWYASVLGDARVFANRGANGIDGVLATATGVALATGAPTFVLIGDVAFLHDSSSLVGLARRSVDLRIVVVDNDGGGIFSFLPQATSLAHDRFEQLFGTPHGVDLAAVAAAHALPVVSVASTDDFVAALDQPGPGVVVVTSNRADNVAVHDRIRSTVADALR